MFKPDSSLENAESGQLGMDDLIGTIVSSSHTHLKSVNACGLLT
jgi:hypothetical protein